MPAISASCWRSAFIGTLSPTMCGWARRRIRADCSFSIRRRRCSIACLDYHQHAVDGERLFEKIVGPELGRPHGRFDRAMAGNHHHNRAVRTRNLLNPLERLQPVDTGQPDIEQHQLDRSTAASASRQASPLSTASTRKPSSARTPLSDCRMPGSSSTIRIRVRIHRDSVSATAAAASSVCRRGHGNSIVNGRHKVYCPRREYWRRARPEYGSQSPVPGRCRGPFVEKYGRNSFSFSSGRDAASRIREDDLDGVRQPARVCTLSIFTRRILHGFGGIIDQIDHDPLELLRIDRDRRQTGRQIDVHFDAFEPAFKHAMPLATTSFRSQSTGCAAGRRENCENSSTSRFTEAVSSRIVSAHSRNTLSTGGGSARAADSPAEEYAPPKA